MATQDFSLQQLQPFLEGNPERGVLRVQVSTALGAFPVNRALVEVAVMLGGGLVLLGLCVLGGLMAVELCKLLWQLTVWLAHKIKGLFIRKEENL